MYILYIQDYGGKQVPCHRKTVQQPQPPMGFLPVDIHQIVCFYPSNPQ